MYITAYKERESIDPKTGLRGTLRDEWRVQNVTKFDAEVLKERFGEGWRRNRPFAIYVLEHRYIRRGVEEPWTPFSATDTLEEALGDIGIRAIPADTPQGRSLAKLQQQWVDEARLAAEKQAAEEKARVEHEEAEMQKKASNQAFQKLLNSPRDGHWATKWNIFIQTATKDTIAAIKVDPEAMAAYQAVMDAVTMPAKRKAIRIFLEGPARYLPR